MNILPSLYSITLLVVLSGSCKNVSQNPMSQFTGMWKLDKYESFDSVKGRWFDSPNRIGYTGYILYDGIGHMGVQLIPPGYNVIDSKNTDSAGAEELRKILQLHAASFSYFANCSITGPNSIEHHRLLSNHPKDWGTTLLRSFEFNGDTLILTAKELIGGFKTRLRWIKQ
jgi:hypothetical protein